METNVRCPKKKPPYLFFQVGRAYASGGPEGVWKIYEATARADGKVRRRAF